MSVLEERFCRCGEEMIVTVANAAAFYGCPNCDGVQPQEIPPIGAPDGKPGKKRRKTAHDRTYDQAIDAESKQWYPRLVGGKGEPNGWPTEPGHEKWANQEEEK